MKERTMTIKSSTPRKRRTAKRRTAKWRTALGCAAALAGVTAVVGGGAAPSAARPVIGMSSGQGHAVAAVERSEVVVPLYPRFVVRPTGLAALMGVKVDGGWLLR
jgi:hypothetical protein